MSMNKAIKSGKEHRKEWKYRGSFCKSVDTQCQNHGGRYKGWECPYCKGNRLHKFKKREQEAKSKLKEVNKELQEFISEELYNRTVDSRDRLINLTKDK